MNIIGVGTDIIDVSRIKRLYYEYGYRFVKRIFTQVETEYAFSKPSPEQELAGFWAAKEAIIKALPFKPRFKDIEIHHNETGKPWVKLHNLPSSFPKNLSISISISHEKSFATAIAIAWTL